MLQTVGGTGYSFQNEDRDDKMSNKGAGINEVVKTQAYCRYAGF